MLTKSQPEPDLFSYAALSREDEAAAREDAALIKAHMKSAAESIIAVGLALKRQKERLPHGMFLPWITAEFSMKIRTAQVIMQRAERWSKYASSAHLPDGQPAALLDEITDPALPTDVRDRVESLLVDGQKVTVADIRKMKAEAQKAQSNADALASRNVELAAKAKAKVPAIDVAAIRTERAREIEDLERRVAELTRQNSALKATQVKATVPVAATSTSGDTPADQSSGNIIHAAFGNASDHADEDDQHREASEYSEESAISVFAGAVESLHGLKFRPSEFWKRVGRKSTHGRIKYEALLEASTVISLLIKEYSK